MSAVDEYRREIEKLQYFVMEAVTAQEEARRLRAENEHLRALLVLARADLVAAKQLIEADQLATAHGLEQTIDKINAWTA